MDSIETHEAVTIVASLLTIAAAGSGTYYYWFHIRKSRREAAEKILARLADTEANVKAAAERCILCNRTFSGDILDLKESQKEMRQAFEDGYRELSKQIAHVYEFLADWKTNGGHERRK